MPIALLTTTLAFIEQHALFSSTGANAGDPDLHSHEAVANKVQTLGGTLAQHRRRNKRVLSRGVQAGQPSTSRVIGALALNATARCQ
jgi:hypothetical protein